MSIWKIHSASLDEVIDLGSLALRMVEIQQHEAPLPFWIQFDASSIDHVRVDALPFRTTRQFRTLKIVSQTSPPPTPTGLNGAVNNGVATITANDASAGTADHELWRRRSDEQQFTPVARVNRGQPIIFQDTLAANFQYTYVIFAVFIEYIPDLYSVPTSEITLELPTLPPPPSTAPTLSLSNVTATSAQASWTNIVGEDGFELYLSTSTIPDPPPASARLPIVGPDVLTQALTGLSPSTQYFSRVRGFNAGGPGPLSVQQTITTTAATGTLPFARFVHTKDANRTIFVDASNSADPDGGTLTYDWDWGDGSAHGSGVAAQHTYASDAFYQVKLTVTKSGGNTDSWTRSIRATSNSNPVYTTRFGGPHVLGQRPSADTQNGYRWKGMTGAQIQITDEFAYDVGTGRSCRFRYNGVPDCQDTNPEQRFLFGEELTEVWYRMFLYFPDGTEIVGSPPRTLNRYHHRTQNQKILGSCNISVGESTFTTTDGDITQDDVGFDLSQFGTVFRLTGTLSFAGSTLAVVGSGTAFTQQLAPGRRLILANGDFEVDTVVNDTQATVKANQAGTSRPIRADAATNVVTSLNTNGNGSAQAHGYTNGQAIVFFNLAGGVGLTNGVVYYVQVLTTTTFKVSLTNGGAEVDITTNYTAGVSRQAVFPAVAAGVTISLRPKIVSVDDSTPPNYSFTVDIPAFSSATNLQVRTLGCTGENNKNFVLWSYENEYGDENVSFQWLTHPADHDRIISFPGDSKMGVNYDTDRQNGKEITVPHVIGDQGGPAPVKRGQWAELRFYARMSKSVAAADGIIGQTYNGIGRLDTNLDMAIQSFWPATQHCWKTFYVLGWANSGFSVDTDVYMGGIDIFDVNPGWTF